ncbi:MAG: hypothetical protein ACREVE_10515 [Gammaproteobacteria bacterium]
MSERETKLRAEFDEALRRVEEAERAMNQSQARLDDALRKGQDTSLARRLKRETDSLARAAERQLNEARAALDAYRNELDRNAAQRMINATRESIETLLQRFDTSRWEGQHHAD